MDEDTHTSHGHSLLKHLSASIKRRAGLTEHHRAGEQPWKMRPLLLLAIALLCSIVVGLHAAGGVLLMRAGLGGLALRNPVAILLIGVSLAIAVFKLKHLVGLMHRKRK